MMARRDDFMRFVQVESDPGGIERVAWIRVRAIVAFIDPDPVDPYRWAQPTTVRCRAVLETGESVWVLGSASEAIAMMAESLRSVG